MVPGQGGGTVDGAAVTWADDDVPASEWLADPKSRATDPSLGIDAAALEWLTASNLWAGSIDADC